MQETEKIDLILKKAPNEDGRREILEADAALKKTFSAMLDKVHETVMNGRPLSVEFDEAERAIETLKRYAGDVEIAFPESRSELVMYIAQLGREILELD